MSYLVKKITSIIYIMSEYTIDTSNNETNTQEIENLAIPFWFENPNVLLNTKYLTEFYPVDSMTTNQKLNAISRTIIIVTILLFLFSRRLRILIIGVITLVAIYMYHYSLNKPVKKESFHPALDVLDDYNADLSITNTFDNPESSNPFSNVLVTDYDYNPEKKPAPPAFNRNINNDILEQAKKMVVEQNPGQPNIADKLFMDLGEQFEFEQSLQPFYSTASSTIPNDQSGFADFCYGSMVSCKEGNSFACARNLHRHTN
jgi:hypothetical protein